MPDDVEELKKLVLALSSENRVLQEQVNILNARLFGRKSEKLSHFDERQARLFDEIELEYKKGPELPAISEDEDRITVPAHGRKKPGRKPLPSDIPRKEVILDIPEEEKTCSCGAEKVRIGEETSEKLDVIPREEYVIRTIRPKYACRKCRGEDDEGQVVAIAPVPACITGKSMLSAALFARMIVSKFCDALPFYRQEKIFRRSGIEISRSLMCSLAMNVHERLSPLQKIMEEEVRKSFFLGIDETSVQVMKEKGRKNTTKSYMWVFRSESRDRDGPVLYFRYEPTRSAAFLKQFLADFRGTAQTDGYEGYDSIFNDMTLIVHAGCMAHARRKFMDAHKASPGDEICEHILDIIKHLYRIEKDARAAGLSPEEIQEMRNEKSKPLMEELHDLLLQLNGAVNPKGLLGVAVSYTLNEWKKLQVFLKDGNIPIDNNFVENAVRPFVLGRKNWLFSGRPEGARASAFYYSLIETAKANGLNPEEYMVRLFEKAPLAVTDADWRALMPFQENFPVPSNGG